MTLVLLKNMGSYAYEIHAFSREQRRRRARVLLETPLRSVRQQARPLKTCRCRACALALLFFSLVYLLVGCLSWRGARVGALEVLDQPIPPRRHSRLRTRMAPDAAGAETSHFFSPNHASRVQKPPDRIIPHNSSPLSACHSSAPFTPLVPSQHQFFRSTALLAPL